MSATVITGPTTPVAAANEAVTTDQLIRSHLPLVGHLVRELQSRLPAHVSRDDLMSAGMMALVTSAQGFDGSRGVPFSRFATIRIRGALTDELRLMDWASRGVRSRARETETVRQQLTGALGRTPRREEIAQVMGVEPAELDTLEADVHRAATLSVEGLAEAAGGDLVPSATEGPEALLVRREEIGLLHDAIAELPERLRIVIEQYFYGNRRMADIAEELGVTESRVSQLRTEALAMLRDGLKGQQSSGIPAQAGPQDLPPAIPAIQRSVDPATRAGKAAKPSRRDSARAAYVAAIAARSTLVTRLAVTTTLGETVIDNPQQFRAAQ